jgi:hypothetical protein
VAEVRQARVKKAAQGAQEEESGKRPREEVVVAATSRKKPHLDVECQLETQKYLRDVRTQHAQLKKSLASLR